jgi:hypothetical protein
LVALAVLTQLVFAGLFLGDLLTTSATYDELVAHHVPVTAHCLNIVTYSRRVYFNSCYDTYEYRGQEFHAVTGKSSSLVFYVDPLNTSYRMNKTAFDQANGEIETETTLVVLLLLGAVVTTSVHQLHLHRRRQRHRVVARVVAHAVESYR